MCYWIILFVIYGTVGKRQIRSVTMYSHRKDFFRTKLAMTTNREFIISRRSQLISKCAQHVVVLHLHLRHMAHTTLLPPPPPPPAGGGHQLLIYSIYMAHNNFLHRVAPTSSSNALALRLLLLLPAELPEVLPLGHQALR